MAKVTFATITRQVQWHAVWGQVDGGGIGRMDVEHGRKVFPTKEQAEACLDVMGYPYDERALRRWDPKQGYSLAEIRRVEVEDRADWL